MIGNTVHQNHKFLKFLSSICCFKSKGIMNNQEVLFQILRKNNLIHPILLEISIKDSKLFFLVNSKIIDLEELSQRYLFILEFRNFTLINNCFLFFFRISKEDYVNYLNFCKKDQSNQIYSPVRKHFDSLDLNFNENLIFPSNRDNPFNNRYAIGEKENMELMQTNISYLLFFNEQIRLYSQLAASRNKNWKEYLQTLIPFNFIISKVNSSTLSTDTRSAFLNLALNLYVDQDPLEELSFENYYRTLEQCEGIKINVALSNVEKLQFKNFLNESLKYLDKKVFLSFKL